MKKTIFILAIIFSSIYSNALLFVRNWTTIKIHPSPSSTLLYPLPGLQTLAGGLQDLDEGNPALVLYYLALVIKVDMANIDVTDIWILFREL